MTETLRITVKYPPDAVGKSRAKLKDERGYTHFGDYKLLEIQPNDIIEVTRTEAPKKMREDGSYWPTSYNIKDWKLLSSGTSNHPDQKSLLDANQQHSAPPRPNLRPRTDPVDQEQMWVNGLLQPWMEAYAQSLSITTTGEMKPVDVNVVEQAARAIATVRHRMFGGTMTTPQTKPPPKEDDMNDEIGF